MVRKMGQKIRESLAFYESLLQGGHWGGGYHHHSSSTHVHNEYNTYNNTNNVENNNVEADGGGEPAQEQAQDPGISLQ